MASDTANAAPHLGQGEVQQIAYQPLRARRRMGDMAEHLRLPGVLAAHHQQVGGHLDRRQRVTQVMADDTDHLLGKQRPVVGGGVGQQQPVVVEFSGVAGLEHLGQVALGEHARVQQGTLVVVQVLRPEQREFMEDTTGMLAADGTYHHHHRLPVGVQQVILDLGDHALDLHQGRPVTLMKSPALQAHQALDVAPQQRFTGVAKPLAEGVVDPGDQAVLRRQQQTAGCFVEQDVDSGVWLLLVGHGRHRFARAPAGGSGADLKL